VLSEGEKKKSLFAIKSLKSAKVIKPGTINYAAVKIYQTDHPGMCNPGTQFEVFGKGRGWNEELFKDVTLKMSGGWDCAPVVRDRNMGIYQDVYLNFTDEFFLFKEVV